MPDLKSATEICGSDSHLHLRKGWHEGNSSSFLYIYTQCIYKRSTQHLSVSPSDVGSINGLSDLSLLKAETNEGREPGPHTKARPKGRRRATSDILS